MGEWVLQIEKEKGRETVRGGGGNKRGRREGNDLDQYDFISQNDP